MPPEPRRRSTSGGPSAEKTTTSSLTIKYTFAPPPHIPALSDPFDVANFDPDVEVPGAVLLNLPAEPYPVGDDPWDREF